MTALCSGGTSEPKPGVAQRVAYTGTVLAGFIEAILGPWAIPLAAAVGVLSWDTPTFCASDPPTLPTWTDADWTELFLELVTPVLSSGSATRKLQDTLMYYAWFQLCQCASVATPAATAFTQPTHIPSINQSGGTVSPQTCYDKTVGVDLLNSQFTFVVTGGGDTRFCIDLVPLFFPNNPQVAHADTDVGGHSMQLLDLGANPPISVTGLVTNAQISGSTAPTAVIMNFWSATFVKNASFGWILDFSSLGVGTPNPFVGNIPSGTRYIELHVEQSNTTAPRHFTLEVSFQCAGANPFGGACCPPDPVAQAYLDRIMNAVTLLQRYLLPFAYLNGAVHSGLSGSGSFAISRLLGMAVNVTTIPARAGLEVANPDRLFDIGWISIQDGDGNIQETRITQAAMTWIPRHFQEATTFGYFLEQGVVATFTELEAET